MEDRIVVAQDSVIGVRVACELTAIEYSGIEQRNSILVMPHIYCLANGHMRKFPVGLRSFSDFIRKTF